MLNLERRSRRTNKPKILGNEIEIMIDHKNGGNLNLNNTTHVSQNKLQWGFALQYPALFACFGKFYWSLKAPVGLLHFLKSRVFIVAIFSCFKTFSMLYFISVFFFKCLAQRFLSELVYKARLI